MGISVLSNLIIATTNMKVFIAISCLLALASAAPTPDHAPVVHRPAPYHPAPVYKPAPVYHKPAPAYHEPAYDTPAAYAYEYGGANFGQNEARDGYATNGGYRVALPDGRTQIVTYTVADGYSGYIADVKYEGEAHYDTH